MIDDLPGTLHRGLAELLEPGAILAVVRAAQAKEGEGRNLAAEAALERVLADIRSECGVSERSDLYLVDSILVAVAILFPGAAEDSSFSQTLVDLGCRVAASWAA